MTFQVDLRGTKPRFRRPELLQHPQIPGPLSGMNPRTILGKSWWDPTRKAAYKANNYCCYACGGSPDDDTYGDRLDAHECYDIDWSKAHARYTETVALCYSCHNFIHAGRLRAMVEGGKEPEHKLRAILRRGMGILNAVQMYPYWRTYVLVLEYVYRLPPSVAATRARDLNLVKPGDILRLPDHRWTVTILQHEYRRNTNGNVECIREST